MVPRKDSVAVQLPKKESMSAGGIALPPSVDLQDPNLPRHGKIVAAGYAVDDYHVGDKVMFSFGYEVVRGDGDVTLIVKEDDIIAKLN